jgi:fructosamine-3-kinase
LDRVLDRLPALFSDAEPPARLHGDLWGGNRFTAAGDEPVVFDPACYGGHREMDLAMMRLFGGFGPRVFEAYDEAYPPLPGRADRLAICQLYPLRVHVNLFGAGYVGQVEQAVVTYE